MSQPILKKDRHLYIGFIKYFMPFPQAGVFLVKPFFYSVPPGYIILKEWKNN